MSVREREREVERSSKVNERIKKAIFKQKCVNDH